MNKQQAKALLSLIADLYQILSIEDPPAPAQELKVVEDK